MSKAVLNKRLKVLVGGIVLSAIFVIAVIALANGSAFIKAKEGGTVYIDDGIQLVIPPGSLKSDTHIIANFMRNHKKAKFVFRPKGITFADDKPAQLQAELSAVGDADGLTLYYAPDETDPDYYTETIEPEVVGGIVIWRISHFSLYYYRTR